jgi:hypothetical protein
MYVLRVWRGAMLRKVEEFNSPVEALAFLANMATEQDGWDYSRAECFNDSGVRQFELIVD